MGSRDIRGYYSLVLTVFGLILLIFPVSSSQLVVNITGYQGGNISIQVFGNETSINVTSSTIPVNVDVPDGEYHVIITYNNITAVRRVNVTNLTSVTFDFTTTSDTSKLIIVNKHSIIAYDGNWTVFDVVRLQNTGDKIFSGEIEFTLPKSALNVHLAGAPPGSEATVKDGVIAVKTSILPNGTADIAYFYLLSSPSYEGVVDFDAKQVLILLTGGEGIDVKNLNYLGLQQMGDNSYHIYSAQNLKKGETYFLSFKESQFPPMQQPMQPEAGRGSGQDNLLLIGGVLIAAGIVIFAYTRYTQMKSKAEAEEDEAAEAEGAEDEKVKGRKKDKEDKKGGWEI
jgi:uncharacterized protein YjeT (DUF2065 family)